MPSVLTKAEIMYKLTLTTYLTIYRLYTKKIVLYIIPNIKFFQFQCLPIFLSFVNRFRHISFKTRDNKICFCLRIKKNGQGENFSKSITIVQFNDRTGLKVL